MLLDKKNQSSLSCVLSLIAFIKQNRPFIPSCSRVLIRTQPAGGTVAARKYEALKGSPFSFHLSRHLISLLGLSSPCLLLQSPSFLLIFQHLTHLIPPSPKRLCAYQADVVVQQLQGEEIFQSQLVETRLRQTCQEHAQSSHNKSSNPPWLTCSVSAGDNSKLQRLHHTAAEPQGALVVSRETLTPQVQRFRRIQRLVSPQGRFG